MQDCISQASSVTIFLGWASIIFLGSCLFIAWKKLSSRRNSLALAVVIAAHPMFWTRGELPCQTDLRQSVVLFAAMGGVILMWGLLRGRWAVDGDS
jgi:hypothetical protein